MRVSNAWASTCPTSWFRLRLEGHNIHLKPWQNITYCIQKPFLHPYKPLQGHDKPL